MKGTKARVIGNIDKKYRPGGYDLALNVKLSAIQNDEKRFLFYFCHGF